MYRATYVQFPVTIATLVAFILLLSNHCSAQESITLSLNSSFERRQRLLNDSFASWLHILATMGSKYCYVTSGTEMTEGNELTYYKTFFVSNGKVDWVEVDYDNGSIMEFPPEKEEENITLTQWFSSFLPLLPPLCITIFTPLSLSNLEQVSVVFHYDNGR
eukprot:TRINITY_DN4685_c0_g2_i3.p1 TRINITY_DN4685_c0_g2~~TRINITY_DN4685_c0_g2_i3.p1  ORF type:complete len:161 (-),score=17.87 TRINITY_DN4685_c0_g2_i3:424-906(-)